MAAVTDKTSEIHGCLDLMKWKGGAEEKRRKGKMGFYI